MSCTIKIIGISVLLAMCGVVFGDEAVDVEGKGDPCEPLKQLASEITSVTGKSVQYSEDSGKTWEAAKNGAKLSANAIIRSGFGSGCEISFRGNTIIIVEPLSSVRIAEYVGNANREKVKANLRYGAVRCGVEHGRVKSETRISTPVAVLAIRGTKTRIEFDCGTYKCKLGVSEGGPADVEARGGRYRLGEGMSSNSFLSRHLQGAIFGRSVFVTGSRDMGGMTGVEVESLVGVAGARDLDGDSGDPLTSREQGDGLYFPDGGGDSDGDGDNCPGGECDPGPDR